jgi:hypothetical protein
MKEKQGSSRKNNHGRSSWEWTRDCEVSDQAPKPLNHEVLLKLRASFFHLTELATSEFLLNLQHSRRPKQTFLKYACLIHEPGATKLSFFLNSGLKKALSLSLDVKCDQQTHKKWCLQLWHQSEDNYPTKSHNNSPMFLAGEFPIRLKLFFAGFKGFFMGLLDYGKSKCYGFGLWE